MKVTLYGHLSSTDSTATSMRLTWVSGDKKPQQVQYGNGKKATSVVTTFSQDDMCTSALASPAKDFGWHDPGYIHSAVMTGLKPSTTFSYRYGSGSVGWSEQIQFSTPPAGGSDELRFITYGDMEKLLFMIHKNINVFLWRQLNEGIKYIVNQDIPFR